MFYTVREILVIVGAIVGIISTAVPLIIKLIKKSRQWTKERDWNKIMEMLPRLIVEAEHFTNYTGQEKKEFVKSRLAIFAINNRIAFNETGLEAAIDDAVKLTREVNVREKDEHSTTIMQNPDFKSITNMNQCSRFIFTKTNNKSTEEN